MADAVATRVLINDGNQYVVVFTNVSDGTGESAVVKIDKSTLTDPKGVEPTKLRIVKAEWAVQGFPYVKLAFDHDTDQTVLVLSGTGKFGLERAGGIVDPATAGGTGDLLLTAPAGSATGSYTVLLYCRK